MEGCLVCLRRLIETGDFSYELQRSGANFFGRNGRIEIEERLDISTHFSMTPKFQDLESSNQKTDKASTDRRIHSAFAIHRVELVSNIS